MEIWRAQVDRKESGEHRSIRYHLRYHVGTLLAFLRGIMSGSCVTPAADCGVRRALSRRIKLFHFGDQPRDGSRDIDRFLLIRQCGPCAGATGCGVHYPGLTERPAERLCLCNVDSRVSQLKYLQLCMRNFLECLTSSGTFLIGTIASTNSRDQPSLSAQVQ